MTNLKVGSKIQRYEFGKPIGSVIEITSVTKKLAKSNTSTFFIEINENNLVERKDERFSTFKKYFVIEEK